MGVKLTIFQIRITFPFQVRVRQIEVPDSIDVHFRLHIGELQFSDRVYDGAPFLGRGIKVEHRIFEHWLGSAGITLQIDE